VWWDAGVADSEQRVKKLNLSNSHSVERYCHSQILKMAELCKISVKQLQSYCDFLFFKKAAVCYLGFFNSENLNGRRGPEAHDAPPRQILSKAVKQL